MKISEMRVNNVTTPIGFNITPLSFSWKVDETDSGRKQRYARVKIYKDDINIYDSVDDKEANSLDYRINIELNPRTQYKWSVEVGADDGTSASSVSRFETGKQDEPWTGKWITSTYEPDVSYVLRKKFILSNNREARLYICGLGVYECHINGQKVGNEYLAPGYHSYDFHLQAQTYDVTSYLVKGENEIQIWLGDGWYRGRLGFDGGYTNLYGDRCYAIAELYVRNKDYELVTATDESWQCKESPVIFSNIYDGEIYDARFESTLNEDLDWKPVKLEAPSKCGALCDRYSLPIVKKERFKVTQVINTPKNETVLDFGQNLTGWVEFKSNLQEGQKIRLTASEIMQDGCFYHDNLRTAKTEFTYISNGKQVSQVRPHFTFFGFRYMKVECLDEQDRNITVDINADDFMAYHIRSDFDEIGKIETGNDKVNQLFSNAMWGQKDNFLDVPTDCPQRDERLGWTGDAQIFSETACYNMYMPAFYRKYLWDMRAEQSIIEGSVPNVVPRLKQGMVAEHGSCPWGDAGVIIPWNVYLHYGSKTLLEECYPGMKAWVDYQKKREEMIDGPHLIKDGFHFADWLALDNPNPGPFGATDSLYIASAYYYKCTRIVSESADILGYAHEAREYGKLADEILTAIQDKYFDEDGLCVSKTQTGSALAIVFDLIPKRAKEGEEGHALNDRVKENNNHLNTGFVGTPILCPALTNSGNNETAVGLLLNEDYPSWLYCVNLGATTIWERWNSVLPDGHISTEGMNSLNHYSYGSIEAWMYGEVAGIRPLEGGFKKALISPHPDKRLGHLTCALNTSAGLYRINWRYNKDGVVTYEIEVPFNAEAELVIDGKRITLQAGIHHK